MVNAVEKIREALEHSDWMIHLEAVDSLVELMRRPGMIGEADALDLLDRFSESGMKSEVKEKLAKSAVLLPERHAARVFARLQGDASFAVRQAVRKSMRKVNQAAFVKPPDDDVVKAVDELVGRKLDKLKDLDINTIIREVIHTARGTAVAEFSHELRNIIQRILTPANKISRTISPDEKARIAVPMTELRKGVNALKEFAESLEWLSQGRDLKFEKTSMRETVKDVVDSVNFTRAVTCTTPSGKDVVFDAASDRLVRAMTNILRNAMEASPPNGNVIFDAFIAEDGEEVEFRVTDSGPGIPPDEREHWFKIGKSGKDGKGHIGLGLFIARQVIEVEHGGTILIEDAPQSGAVFRIRIPMESRKR